MNKEKDLTKILSEAFTKLLKLSFLREKILQIESGDEFEKLQNRYINELSKTVKMLEEVLQLDEKQELDFLHLVICSLIFDSIFCTKEETTPILLILNQELWKTLDAHYTESLKLIEKFFKRIMSLRTAEFYVRPEIWNQLKIYNDENITIFWLFETCKQLHPDDADIWYLMGETYKRLAAYAKQKGKSYKRFVELAEECLTKTVKLNPKKENAWSLLARLYFEEKQYDKALECYMKRLKLAEYKSWSFWKAIAEVYEAKGDLQKALECLNKVVELNPSPHNYLSLALMYAKLKCKSEAIQAIKNAETKLVEIGRKFNEPELIELYNAYYELNEYKKCAEIIGLMFANAKESLLRGAKTKWIKHRFERYHQLVANLISKLIAGELPKQQKIELLKHITERLTEYTN